jgi:GNAT superfamily N-acetyltransferase
MNLQIRQAQTTDAGAITRILRSLGWFAHLNSEPVETTEARIAHNMEPCNAADSHSVYVAENSAGDVVGYGAVHWMPTLFLPGPEGYVSELFVEEPARGQGAGAKLLEAMKEEAKARGCSRLLVVNMRYRESYARGFYRKCGWEERPDAANFVLRLS